MVRAAVIPGMLNTEQLEERTNIRGWGQWVQSGSGRSIGYASSIWHRDVLNGFRKSRVLYPITDDEAIAVDKLVAGMRSHDHRWTAVLIGLYVRETSHRDLARVIGCEKNMVGALRDNALSFLIAKLERL